MKIKRIVCFVLVFTIFATMLCMPTAFSVEDSSKISATLANKIKRTSSDELIPVYVFLENTNLNEVSENLKNNYGIDSETYEDPKLFYAEIVSNFVVGEKTVGEILRESNLTYSDLDLDAESSPLSYQLRKKVNLMENESVNTFLKKYRCEVAKTIEKQMADFKKESGTLIDSYIYESIYGNFLIAAVPSKNIDLLNENKFVTGIDLFEESKEETDVWNSNLITESDSNDGLGGTNYNHGSGYDGTGVNIGILEANSGKYDSNDYNLTDANITFVDNPDFNTSNISSHATNVTALICGKKTTIGGKTYEGAVKGANIYQMPVTASTNVYSAMEELVLSYNANIINYSGGSNWGIGYSSYDRAVDSIIANSKLSFVVAAGNRGNGDKNINSPGKAYNAITIGNLATKQYNNALPSPYSINGSSSTKEASYLTNKPDLVAPGTSIYLPTSIDSVHSIGSGTSYAAPIVTGIAAQIMQSCPVTKTNKNSLKSYLVCGADNGSITQTTPSYGNLTDESGSGLVNAVKSFELAHSLDETYGVWTPGAIAPTPYYDEAEIELYEGERIRIALTFRKPENIAITSDYGNDIDIRLIEESLGFSVVSESTNNNVEVIDVEVPADGTYILQMKLKSSLLAWGTNPELRYWMCWRIEPSIS